MANGRIDIYHDMLTKRDVSSQCSTRRNNASGRNDHIFSNIGFWMYDGDKTPPSLFDELHIMQTGNNVSNRTNKQIVRQRLVVLDRSQNRRISLIAVQNRCSAVKETSDRRPRNRAAYTFLSIMRGFPAHCTCPNNNQPFIHTHCSLDRPALRLLSADHLYDGAYTLNILDFQATVYR